MLVEDYDDHELKEASKEKVIVEFVMFLMCQHEDHHSVLPLCERFIDLNSTALMILTVDVQNLLAFDGMWRCPSTTSVGESITSPEDAWLGFSVSDISVDENTTYPSSFQSTKMHPTPGD